MRDLTVLTFILAFIILTGTVQATQTPVPTPTPVPTTGCVTKTVCGGEGVGELCDPNIGPPGATCLGDGVWLPASEIEVCVTGPLVLQCGPTSPTAVITISGDYFDHVAPPSFSPQNITEPGIHEVTVTVFTACCMQIDFHGCYSAPEAVEFKVNVLAVWPDCAPCEPDSAEWVCNRYFPSGTNGFTCSSEAMTFSNVHDIEFLLNDRVSGIGEIGTEEIIMWWEMRVTQGQIVLYEHSWYANNSAPGQPYVSGAEIVCETTCTGQNRALVTDHYMASATIPSGLLGALWCDAIRGISSCQDWDPCSGTSILTWRAEHRWLDQKIFVNYNEPTRKLVATFPDSSVVMSRSVAVHGLVGETTCSPVVTFLSDCSHQKTGGI